MALAELGHGAKEGRTGRAKWGRESFGASVTASEVVTVSCGTSHLMEVRKVGSSLRLATEASGPMGRGDLDACKRVSGALPGRQDGLRSGWLLSLGSNIVRDVCGVVNTAALTEDRALDTWATGMEEQVWTQLLVLCKTRLRVWRRCRRREISSF